MNENSIWANFKVGISLIEFHSSKKYCKSKQIVKGHKQNGKGWPLYYAIESKEKWQNGSARCAEAVKVTAAATRVTKTVNSNSFQSLAL